jgi:hypothetical protein
LNTEHGTANAQPGKSSEMPVLKLCVCHFYYIAGIIFRLKWKVNIFISLKTLKNLTVYVAK